MDKFERAGVSKTRIGQTLFDRQAQIEAGESHSLKVSGLAAAARLGVAELLTVEGVEVERSHLWAERLVRVVEGNGWRIELLAGESLARLAMEEADMLGRVSLNANVFWGLSDHSWPLTAELKSVSQRMSNAMGDAHEESSQPVGRPAQDTTSCERA